MPTNTTEGERYVKTCLGDWKMLFLNRKWTPPIKKRKSFHTSSSSCRSPIMSSSPLGSTTSSSPGLLGIAGLWKIRRMEAVELIHTIMFIELRKKYSTSSSRRLRASVMSSSPLYSTTSWSAVLTSSSPGLWGTAGLWKSGRMEAVELIHIVMFIELGQKYST